jgi:hypothetical protein
MNPELQQRIQNLMGDNSQPNLVTTEMPSESDFGQYSSVSVLPKSDNNGLVEGKDYVTVGGQMFWPWELEGIMGKDGAFDAKAVNQFIESLPQKPNLKELSSLRDFANPPSSTREVSNLMGATLSPMKSGQFSDREIDLYRKSLGMAEGGEVSREEMMMQAMEGEAEGQANPDEAIRSSIEELLAQASQTEDPSERDQYLHLAEAAEIGAEAPMAQAAKELAQAGRGEDTHLAHLRAGEVVIPPEAFEDEEFEGLIEKKFRELDIDPERMVVGVGIASLNPITGLEEFGFFKKLAKSVKKVVKKVVKPLAKFAQFLPPPVGPIAALANKAFTVYDVAKGRASPLALLTMGKGAPAGGGSGGISSLFGGVKEFVTKGADGVGLLGNVGKGLGSLFTGPGADGFGRFGKLGDLVTGPGADGFGRFGKLGDLVTGPGADGFGRFGKLGDLVTGPGADKIGRFGRLGDFAGGIGDALGVTNYAGQVPQTFEEMYANASPQERAYMDVELQTGLTEDEIMQRVSWEQAAQTGQTLGRDPYDVLDEVYQSEGDGSQGPTSVQQTILDMQAAGSTPEQILQALNQSGSQQQAQGGGTPQWLKTIGDYLGFGGKSGLEDVYGPGTTNPISGLFGGSGGGGFNLGGVGGAGIAAVLAKLAYDEAKDRKGVQLTPAMTMSRYGGYQLAKRDAEAAGEAPPDRRDFGMMEDMPVLSGGRKTPVAEEPVAEEPVAGMRYGGEVMPMPMRYGGMVPMAYATGGNVSTEDFKKKNGKINGEGTETSDDIPAMLSDGEFVMTGRAVRGAGSFDMDSNNGIITLTPKGGEDRDKGTQLMYEMMELFAEYADKPKAKRVKAA